MQNCVTSNPTSILEEALILIDILASHSKVDNIVACQMEFLTPLLRACSYKCEKSQKRDIIELMADVILKFSEKNVNLQLFES